MKPAALTLAFLLALALPSATAEAQAASDHPNIVYVICDDLGYGDIHCLAPETSKIPTPHADKLASQGMVFTDAHSGSSVCSPTRYGIMTGRYSWRTRLQRGVVTGYAPSLIAEGRPTVASFLKAQGYRTGIVGKWHLDFQYLDPDSGEPYSQKNHKSPPVGARIPRCALSALDQHRMSHIADHSRSFFGTAQESERNISRTPSDIQKPLTHSRCQPIHHRVLPDPMDANRHDVVHDVILRGDR